MKIGLYDGSWGDKKRYRIFDCCEINLDNMEYGTDYTRYYNGPDETVDDITFAVRHFSITSGVSKIQNPITDESNLLMASPFWDWDSTLELRNWMGDHYTSLNLTREPDDWEDAVYWKYYVRVANTSFVEWKNPTSTTFNSATTYWTCDDAYSPQKIYYGIGDYAPSFQIGQCLYNPPNGVMTGISGTIAGATYSGYGCGTNVSDASAGTRRTRLFAYKNLDEEFVGYEGMTVYSGNTAFPLHFFPLYDILTPNPAREMSYKHLWQMAHIIYNNKEYIGWGEIKYDYSHPENMLSADFTCVPIELFEGAIDPDPDNPPSYSTGIHAGNDGSAGTGSGLPDGDIMVPTGLHGGLSATTSSNSVGIHQYVINGENIGKLQESLWDVEGDFWTRFANITYNPMAGILGLFMIPDQLIPTNLVSEQNVRVAGKVFDGQGITGLPAVEADAVNPGYNITKPVQYKLDEPDYVFTLSGDRQPYESFGDFANTKVIIHIPFCGSAQLNPEECIGGRIEVYYYCDTLTGNVCAQVVCVDMNRRSDGALRNHVSAILTGNCAYTTPLAGSDSQVAATAMSSLTNFGGSIIASAASGNPIPAIISGVKGATDFMTANNSTMTVGNMTGNAGWLGFRSFKVDVTWGQYLDTDGCYSSVNGRPSCDDARIIAEFSGYLEGTANTAGILYANDAEKQKIRDAISNGIFVNIHESE